jgi:hypothetical protein
MSYLRSGTCHGSAIGSPLGVAYYKSIQYASAFSVVLPEGIDARNPRLSLACIAGADEIVRDCIAFAKIDVVCTVRSSV